MSWVISLILAGSMFAGEANLPLSARHGYVETNAKQVVRLDETERFEQTYPLTANGRISVSNINGPITIEAWDRNEVRLEAVKTAENREYLQDVEIKIDARRDALSIETDYENLNRRRSIGQRQNYGKIQVAYRLQVPRGAILDEIEAVNGSVTVSNMTNVTKISAVNGEIRATNLRGTAILETVNGVVEADFATIERTSQITLSTVNGRANLVIPSDVDATIRADTVNGNIVNDFGLPVRRGEYVGRDLYGRIGGGDAKIKLNSVNGPLTVRRRQDGKAIKPVTNLLSQRETADEDDEAVISATKKASEKTSRKAVRSTKKMIDATEIREAMDEARVEIEKSQKELARVNIDSQKLAAQIRDAQKVQVEAMARMRENGWLNGSPFVSRRSGTLGVKGTPKVTIDARNCVVIVRGWDKQEVQYSVTRYSRSNNAEPIQYTANTNEREVTIKVNEGAEQNGLFGDANRVRVEVFVPKKSNLRILTDREIRVEGVSGELDLQGGDEAVNVRESGGTLRVSTVDGRIRVIGFDGEIVSKSVDGAINLEGNFQKLSAETVEGTIVLVLPDDASVNIESNRDDVNAEGLPIVFMGARQNVSTWKVGGGGEKFRLSTSEDGKIFVRSAGQIKPTLQ